jgi:PIN domain nuclease of toxin-antitoxin system
MSENLLYVVDTHVLIWYFTGSNRLNREIKNRIDEVRLQGGRLLIPTIVLSEALDVAEKNKVEFDFSSMYRLIVHEPEFAIVEYDHEIFEETLKVSGIQEIHDRIIVATARYYEAGVLTKDRIILASGEVEPFSS